MARSALGRGRLRTCAAVAAISAAALAAGGNATAALPDGRAWELVSPADKNDAPVHFPTGPLGPGFAQFNATTMAAEDGSGIMWASALPFADPDNGLPMNYLSTRTADGWTTRSGSPAPLDPAPSLASISMARDAVGDLSKLILATTQQYGNDTSPIRFVRRDVYTRDVADGALTWISQPEGRASTVNGDALYVGKSTDASHIVFATTEEMTTAAVPNTRGRLVYERSGGVTKLVNVDSNGNLIGTCGASLGYRTANLNYSDNAISADGQRIYFSQPEPGVASPAACTVPTSLYLREGTTTTKVNASQRTVPDTARPAVFLAASKDGSVVYFRTTEALIDDVTPGTDPLIYRYEIGGDLTVVTPNDDGAADASIIVGLSDDGSRGFLVARGALAGGGVAGEHNLYAFDEDGLRYVGGFRDGNQDLRPTTNFQYYTAPMRTTPDGTTIAFESTMDIGSYSTGGARQVYLYSPATGTICVSCASDPADMKGQASLFRDHPLRQFTSARSRNLATDGSYVFFDTASALVPEDVDGEIDVYQWKDGAVHLLSSGDSSEPTYFMDAGVDGTDVFFVTSDRLVPQDTNADPDIYDARVGGGFPVDPPAPGHCVGDVCQGQPRGPPQLPQILSDTDFGDGNVDEPDVDDVAFSVGRVTARAKRRLAKSGSLTLTTRVAGAGTVKAVVRARIGRRDVVIDRVFAEAAKAGSPRLVVRLNTRAKRQLAKKRKLRLNVVVTFDRSSVSRTATFVIAAPKRAPARAKSKRGR